MQHYKYHQELTDGEGKCGVPAWSGGMPAGFCDEPAYGPQEPDQRRYGRWQNGRWLPGYSSALTCYGHGGPKEKAKVQT